LCGLPLPPKAFQVDGVNCRPPEKPLPVLADQLPLLSQEASLSQTPAGAALAVPAIASGAPSAIAPATASRRTCLDVDVRERKDILSGFSSMGGECLEGRRRHTCPGQP